MIKQVMEFCRRSLVANRISISQQETHFDDVVFSPYAYEQEFVKTVIDGRSVTILSIPDMGDCLTAGRTIKVEGLEKLSRHLFTTSRHVASLVGHDGPVSAHLFLAHAGSESFPTHTDPDDVFIYVVAGVKSMEVQGVRYDISAGCGLFIPHDTPHRALNEEESIMISFGLERFTLEKIPS